MEIPEKPKCSNIEENYPTDHIRPAEVMDENDPPVYVKSELKQSNYVQHLGVVEEYVPIDWVKLKLGDEVVDMEHKPVKRGNVFKKSEGFEYCIAVGFEGGVDSRFYTRAEMERYLRLVVKPKSEEQKIELTYPELIFTGKQIKDLAKDLTDTGEVRLSISGIKIINQ